MIDPRAFSIAELMGHDNYMMFLVLLFALGSAGLIFFCKLYCNFLICSYFNDIVNDIVVSQIANLFSFVAGIKYGFFQDQDQIIWLFFYSFFKVFEISGLNIDSLGPILIFLAHHTDISSVNQLYELQILCDHEICKNLFDLYINIDPSYRQEFFEKLFSFVEWWGDNSTKEQDKQFVSQFIEFLCRDYFTQAEILEIFDNIQKQNPKLQLRWFK